jgi:hypothetical protein
MRLLRTLVVPLLMLLTSCRTPVDASGWPLVSETRYPITARIPKNWRAEASRNEIIPVDSWILSGIASDERVIVSIEWLPRSGRHSSGFPGGRVGTERHESMVVAGKQRDVIVVEEENLVRTDFDTNALAVSVIGHSKTDRALSIVRKVMESILVDESVNPPPSAVPGLLALELTRAFARSKGLPDTGIVTTRPGNEPNTFNMTIFHSHGLVGVLADVSAGRVTELR